MGQALTGRFSGLSAGSARGALLGAASVVVVGVAVGLVATGVTSGEVAATMLFLPVFAAGLLGGRPAGYAGAVVATVLYAMLRRSDLASVGGASAGVLVLTRAGAYLVAGHVGSLAQALLPGGAGAKAGAAAPLPGRRASAAAGHWAAGPQAASAGPAGPPPQARWDAPWQAEADRPAAYDRDRPVLAGVGSARDGAPFHGGYGGDNGYGGQPTIVSSGTWPSEPPRDAQRGSDDPGGPPSDEGDPGGWSPPGPGWQDDRGWPGDGAAPAPESTWQAGEGPPLADDSWAAVQETWRRQHGVPPEEDHGAITDERAAHQQAWPHEPQGRGVGLDDAGGAAPDPWGQPPPRPAGPEGDPWGQPPPPDPRTEQSRGGWPPSAATRPWGPAPEVGRGGPPSGEQPAVAGDAWSGAPADDRWGPPSGEHSAAGDAWGNAAPTGGTWPPAPGPAPGTWDAAQGGGAGSGWDAAQGGGAGSGWDAAQGSADQGWAPQGPVDQGWDRAQGPDDRGWDAPAAGTWPTTGQTAAVWDDPAAGHVRQPEPPWSPPADAGWAGAGAAGTAAGGLGGHASPPPSPPPSYSSLPAVDPETGLWTAKFLRDRLMSERDRSRRSGRPFSLVLVQVPDGPLAQLPYRRQLTLLRELGYQFVAGGVVDHLVHVPDQAQHWFAVILPDTDRSGAQVLERRLRLGIGGYLSSRGLRLRDLESASLTAPDDDPAMAAIWDALIGPDDAGSSSMPFGY